MALLTKDQAAAELGIPVSTLTKLVTARKVPFTRVGGTRNVKFSPKDIADIIAAGRVEPVKAEAQVTGAPRRRKAAAA